MLFSTLALVAFLHVLVVPAYVPAWPSNATVQDANTSKLYLQWHRNGSDWEDVHQSAVSGPSITPVHGIFVHFSEYGAGDKPTTTPWIALVSCDANATNSSPSTDIFSMAKARGAKSAILYSLSSESCVINPAYQSPALDIFTTLTLNSARRIEYQFGQFGPSSEAYYGYFNATMLNNAAQTLNNTIASGYPDAPGFLFATVPALDSSSSATSGASQRDANGTGTSGSDDDDGGNQNTGIAMIVLYAITGCVSALFFAVIVSGAIRAIRYPERYGPRTADPALGGGQSRARGLGRAILDTFPIVKFGSSDRQSTLPNSKDIESSATDESSTAVPLAQLGRMAGRDERQHSRREGTVASPASDKRREDNRASERASQAELPPRTDMAEQGTSHLPSASPREIDAGMPECIGRETCPICIVDFEEGDDLRVLPCEGKHRFHQFCVDPWLLELSGSCPICRQDFHALETILSGEPENEASPDNGHGTAGTSSTQNRFSRYLRFARRRQQHVNVEQGSPPSPAS